MLDTIKEFLLGLWIKLTLMGRLAWEMLSNLLTTLLGKLMEVAV